MINLTEVQEALCQFIIDSSKREASGYAVQALPEAVKSLIELSKFIQIQK